MRSFVLLSLLAAVACSSEETDSGHTLKTGGSTTAVGGENENGEHGSNAPSGPTSSPAAGTALGSETWADGKTLSANVTISAGATVTIAPGATVAVADGVAITIKGTLKVAASTSHAKLSGTSWAGIVVASGGTLDADGLELSKPTSAIWTQQGNAGASFANGVIDAATPFKMEAGSKLSILKSTVTATSGSAIAGTFTASFMTYDKTTAGGLSLNDALGTMTITDSTLKGSGSGDYIISQKGHLVSVAYSTIAGAHCGFHFDSVDQYTIDHVSDDTNSYGAMLYGSGAGPNTVTSSNIRSLDKDLDMSGTNGALVVTDSLTGGKNNLQANAKIVSPRTVAVTDAKPRAQ